MEEIDQHCMYFNNTTNTLVCVGGSVGPPVGRKLCHADDVWGSNMLFTCIHANPERLYTVMKRTDSSNVVRDSLKQLQEVASRCDVCPKAWLRS